MNYYLGIAEVKYLRRRGNGRINPYWRKASKIKENALYYITYNSQGGSFLGGA